MGASGDCQDCFQTWQKHCQRRHQMASPDGRHFVHKVGHSEQNPGELQRLDFKLTDEDMAVMDSLNVGWRHLLWAETSMHPDYPFKDCLPWDYKLQKPGVGATAGAK